MSSNLELQRLLENLACSCRILEMEGHGDMTLGHLSLRDPAGGGFWMKRNRVGLGEIRGAQDFVLVGFDGRKLAGEGGRHSEWPIHASIYRRRSDVAAVAHTHPLHASVFSASSLTLQPYTLEADYFEELPRHQDAVALINEPEEGEALAASLGNNFAVLMANHGVTFCGTSIEHMTCIGVFLEKACRVQLLGDGARIEPSFPNAATRKRRRAQIMPGSVHIEQSWEFFMRKLRAAEVAGLVRPGTWLAAAEA